MKVQSINNYNNNNPAFKASVVPYPELVNNYKGASVNANKADALLSDPVSAFFSKLAKVFRLLNTPEVEIEAKNIQAGIDALFDNPAAGKKLNMFA